MANMQTDAVDTQWFIDRLADKRLSQRKLAKLVGMDPSSLSLLLHGKRKMNIDKATDIARILGVPVATVIRKAGVVIDENTGHRSLPLVGALTHDGTAAINWNESENRVSVDATLPPDAVALRWQTMQTPGDVYDGWIAVTVPPKEPSLEMVGRYCLVGTDGKTLARQVRRGYSDGKYTLVQWGAEPMHDVRIDWYSPIILILPS